MATISRACHITNTNGHELDKTIDIYRRATNYIIDIVILRYDDIMKITGDGKVPAQKKRMTFVESLIHTTKKNKAVYKRFDREFYKFPSYFRRAAIVYAIGTVSSYKSLVENWENGGRRGSKPFLNKTRALFPCFYRGASFLENDDSPIVSLKIYNGRDWVWKTYTIRSCDFLYPKKNLCGWKKSAPVLEKRGHRYELRFAYTCKSSAFPKFKKDAEVDTVIGVDLGINTDATCSVIKKNGTVMGQKFINHPIKVFNCDLSASRNIAARYFIRALSKSLSAKEELQVLAKVPELAKRTSCCLNTLVEASHILKELSCDDVRQKTEAA